MAKGTELETPRRYDLFVAYAEDDRAWVEGFLLPALALPAGRVRTQEDFAPGRPLVDQFARAIDESRYTVLILSPAFVADRWATLAKDLVAYLNAEGARGRLIPLRLQPAELGLELRSLVALDFTDPEGWEDEAAELRALLGQPPVAPEAIPCPYPGLRAFGEHDHERFFGREDEAKELVARLRTHPFLAVIGPSGCGKSSLVFAGLVPALRRSRLFGAGPWAAFSLRPGAAPMRAGTTVIGSELPAAGPSAAGPPAAGPTLVDLLRAPPGKLLLVVDQFEELFAIARDRTPGDERPFQEALLRLAQAPGCRVVLTVRADFYPDLMASPLWPEIQAHRGEVLPLGTDGLERAIARPAEKVGVHVEAALVERLVADAADEPGALPLMQEALVYLWEELRGRFLGVDAYEALGEQADEATGDGAPRTGLQVAMARHADGALAALAPEQGPIARRIFLRLVQFGEGRADTRRQRSVDGLRSVGDDPELFEATLGQLAERRLLTLSAVVREPEQGQGQDQGQAQDKDKGKDNGRAGEKTEVRVDLAHEALIGGWPWLQQLLAERREAEQARQRLEAKAAEWNRLGRGGGLLDEVELLEAERWLAGREASELGVSPELAALARASARAEASRERSHYLGQASGGGVGTGLGYGFAFGLAYWSLFPRSSMDTALLLSLSLFPVGALVGLCIGLGIWLGRADRTRRVVATATIGTVAGSAVYVLYQRFVLPSTEPILLDHMVSGGLLGAGLGLGVGLAETERRLVGATLGGLAGTVLASRVGVLPWENSTVVLAGLVLGGLTGLGFRATAVKPSPRPALPAPS